MATQSNLESLAVRFAPHIVLLQDFFRERGVPFGSPEDLYPFAARLSTPGTFQDDMSSMLRTVLYRENLSLTRVELLELVCVAVGGTQVDSSAQDVHEPVDQLLVFVNIVFLSLRKQPFDRGTEVTADPHLEPLPVSKTVELIDTPAMAIPAVLSEAQTPVLTRTWAEVGPADHPPLGSLGSRLPMTDRIEAIPADHALPEAERNDARTSISEAEHEPSSFHEAFSFKDASAFAVPLPGSSSGERRYAPPGRVGISGRQRRFLSLPATLLAGIVLSFLAVGVFWPHHKPVQQAAVPIVADTGSTTEPTTPKPSAYVRSAENVEGAAGSSVTDLPRALAAPRQGLGPVTSAQSSSRSSVNPEREPTEPASTQGATASSPGASLNQRNTLSSSTAGLRNASVAPTVPEVSGGPAGVRPPQTTKRSPHPHDAVPVQHVGRRGLFSVSSGVMSANLVSAPPPEYPMLARLTHIEGRVILQAVVSRNGSVAATHVLQGHHLLRSAAERAVRSWRYRPYVVDGHPTDIETVVFVDFRLRH